MTLGKGKTLLGIDRKLLYSNVCWQNPAMFCLYTFPAHNLNFHWRWKWCQNPSYVLKSFLLYVTILYHKTRLTHTSLSLRFVITKCEFRKDLIPFEYGAPFTLTWKKTGLVARGVQFSFLLVHFPCFPTFFLCHQYYSGHSNYHICAQFSHQKFIRVERTLFSYKIIWYVIWPACYFWDFLLF